MATKVIVFCADGTWDSAERGGDASNVLKLFHSLAGPLTVGAPQDAEQERQWRGSDGGLLQIAKYIYGVGASDNWLNQKLGGGVGTGLVARLLRGYTFLSRNYATGDAIVLTGFSRGAYTARALGGFVRAMGLLDWQKLNLGDGPSELGYQYAAAAWYRYQQKRLQATRSPNWLGRLEGFVAGIPELAPGLALTPQFRADEVEIAAIGVWDTVGALGIPELSPDHDARLDLLRFVDTQLPAGVKAGFHAVAADEQRVDFTPTLWDPDARVVQRLFPGAHADVGGGYPLEQSQLSDIALGWMMAQLQGVGVYFTQAPAVGEEFATGPMHSPWTSPGFALRPVGPREFPPYADVGRRIALAPELRTRLGKLVSTISATVPPRTQAVPYFPLALVNAGYLNTAGLEANP